MRSNKSPDGRYTMLENEFNNGEDGSESEPIPPLLKAYINEQIQNAHNTEQESQKKKWKKSWRSASPITKGTFILTASVAIATVAYAFIAVFQLREMRHSNQLTQSALEKADRSSLESSKQFQVQLRHFDASLGQTQILAGQAVTQATQTAKLAADTHALAAQAKTQAEASQKIATNASIQSQATQFLANNSAGQLQTMRRQFEVSQRAWIEIVDSSIALLKYPDNGGFSVNPKLVFKNGGNIPANNVKVVAWVILPDQTKDVEAQAITAEKYWCDRGLHDPEITLYSISQRIYPGKTKDYTFVFGGGDARTGGKIGSQGIIQPVMVGCILYQFSSSSEIHYTGFILTLHRKDPNGQIGSLIYGREIAPENVYISDFWDGLAESN
jgi:hypothetical protein